MAMELARRGANIVINYGAAGYDPVVGQWAKGGPSGIGVIILTLSVLSPGVSVLVSALVILWMDPDMGRKPLFLYCGIYAAAFFYYRFVLMRRPLGWVMTGPEDIDAAAHAGGGAR